MEIKKEMLKEFNRKIDSLQYSINSIIRMLEQMETFLNYRI